MVSNLKMRFSPSTSITVLRYRGFNVFMASLTLDLILKITRDILFHIQSGKIPPIVTKIKLPPMVTKQDIVTTGSNSMVPETNAPCFSYYHRW